MLASDEEGAPLDALRFSLASDIVELVVLTTDNAFLQTLREAVGNTRRLWHVSSPDKISDLLVAGEVGILVLDVQTLNEAADVFIGQLKRQFPDLVVVVAGNRDAETSLAGLISAGLVYRFIHKPMSPGRAKLFAEAAVKKYEEQRRRAAATTPPTRPSKNRGALAGSAIAVLGLIFAAVWLVHRNSADDAAPAHAATASAPPAGSPLLDSAAAALAANRLLEPAGDNALDLYSQAVSRNSADLVARSGLAEVRERLLARAENDLLEERLDEASADIEAARKSGVEAGRIAFLTAQLAKSREQLNTAQSSLRMRSEAKAIGDKAATLLALADQRIGETRLIDPERDSALFYIQEALSLDPNSVAAHDALQRLTARLLAEARGAIDRRDWSHAAAWLEASGGVAPAADVDALKSLMAGAQRQVEADAWLRLLRNAADRLQEDRLVEPVNDSAKYYLLTLRGLDPGNAGLGPAMQDLGNRLLAKARRAIGLEQYDAARSWLDEAVTIGIASPELNAAQRDLDAAIAAQKFLANVVAAGDLALVKSVQPAYPKKAESNKTQGWVELDFTVTESGSVKDITIHAASPPGVFDEAAITALSQWRYKPVLHDAKPVAQRARIRVRFVLAG